MDTTLILLEAAKTASQMIANEPESLATAKSITVMIQQLDEMLDSTNFGRIGALAPHQRGALAHHFQAVADRLRTMLSVGVQVEALGGHAPYRIPLVRALRRLERALRRQQLPVAPLLVEPVVVRMPGTGRLQVLDPASPLERYVARAVQPAQPEEQEDGGWFVELEGFPGVWADGPTREECLRTLTEVLREWLLIKLNHRDPDIPVVGDIDLATLARG